MAQRRAIVRLCALREVLGTRATQAFVAVAPDGWFGRDIRRVFFSRDAVDR